MTFKHIIRPLLLSVLTVFAVTACNEKKPEKDIITHKQAKKAPAKPISMQDYNHSDKVDWVGLQYIVAIGRRAENDTSLVTDDSGNRYHNNRITVRIVRPDGSEFFDRTFTKDDFSSVVNAAYRQKNTLLGIVVDHTDENNIYLAASVGSPDVLSDEFIPLLIAISRTGNITVTKDTRPDTSETPADDDI